MGRYKENSNWGAKNLVDLVMKLRSAGGITSSEAEQIVSGFISSGGYVTSAYVAGATVTSAEHATSAGTIDGTLPISKGGTGADNISSARKALYGDSLTTSADYFLGITSN